MSVVEQTYPFVDVHLQSAIVEREEVVVVDAGLVALIVLQHNKQQLNLHFVLNYSLKKKSSSAIRHQLAISRAIILTTSMLVLL